MQKVAGLPVGEPWHKYKQHEWPDKIVVNGIEGFAPIREELEQLAKFWYLIALNIEADWLVWRCYGGEYRQRNFAYRRLTGIALLIGDDAVQKMVDEARKEFAATHDPELAQVLLYGTDEEREAFMRKTNAEEDAMMAADDAAETAGGEEARSSP